MPLVLDAHTHAFPASLAAHAISHLTSISHGYPIRAHHDGTTAGLLGSMDRAGIRRAFMCSIATRPSQVCRITDWAASVASDRLISFASIHPDFERPEAEIDRIAALGLPGLKFHPQYQDCRVDDPRVLRIARAAAKAGLAMSIHAGYDLAFERTDIACPSRIRALHDAVPDLRLLACHLGGWNQWEESLREIAGQNIYIETSFCVGQCESSLLERIIEKHSPDRLLFGTDSPWADQTADLAAFRALPLSAEAMTKALWTNAHRFLNMSPNE